MTDNNEEICYLQLFSVYHSKKPNSVRVVFDSSAKYQSLSFNYDLLKKLGLYNSLLGIRGASYTIMEIKASQVCV